MRAMWSHHPAGRPVTGTTIFPDSCSRSSAAYAAAVSLPAVVSVSSISKSTAFTPLGSRSTRGFISSEQPADARPGDLVDRVERRRAQDDEDHAERRGLA